MFNKKLKNDIEKLKLDIYNIHQKLNGDYSFNLLTSEYMNNPGVINDIKLLQAENKKLKALLNEVIDHIYKENK